MEDMSAGTLSFGAINFVGVYLLPSMLAQYKAQFPNINISMKITSSQQLTPLLEPNGRNFSSYRIIFPSTSPFFTRTRFVKIILYLLRRRNIHWRSRTGVLSTISSMRHF